MVVDKHKHSRRNVLFSVIHTFQYNESDPCQNITKATGSSHNQPKKHSMSSNNHPYNYQWQQIWTWHYIEMSINGASTIFGLISKIIQYWIGHCNAKPTCWQSSLAKHIATRSLSHSENERQWSVNDFWSCKYGNSVLIRLLPFKINVLAVFIGITDNVTVTAPFWKWASTERQQILVM